MLSLSCKNLKSKSPIQLPPYIPIESVTQIRNRYDLLDMEHKYDLFLDQNQHLLLLHDLIEDYLDIRDALTIQRQRIEREDRNKLYNQELLVNYCPPCEYNHNFQTILPDDLKLSQEQINQGYKPYPKEPKEYKCGCQSIKYYAQCECKRVTSICKNPKCNERLYPTIKMHYYCIDHRILKERSERMEQKLTSIKKELADIRRHSNNLNPRVSRYPWKNL